jgi:hypothetical protein
MRNCEALVTPKHSSNLSALRRSPKLSNFIHLWTSVLSRRVGLVMVGVANLALQHVHALIAVSQADVHILARSRVYA